MDDIPIGLFKTQEAAEKFAKTVSVKTCEKIAKQNDLYTSSHVCVYVCAFKAGKMTNAHQVRRKDDM